MTRSRVKIHEIVAENEKEDETLNIAFENNETMREEDKQHLKKIKMLTIYAISMVFLIEFQSSIIIKVIKVEMK